MATLYSSNQFEIKKGSYSRPPLLGVAHVVHSKQATPPSIPNGLWERYKGTTTTFCVRTSGSVILTPLRYNSGSRLYPQGMLTRNFLILCSLAAVLVQADLDTNSNHAAQAMFTDKDSTSDEAPTESMNAISSDQPNSEHDKPQYYNGGTADVSSTSVEVGQDASKPNGVTGPGGAANSVEDRDEDESSDEGVKKRIPPPPPPPPPAPQQKSRKLVGPAGGNRRKAAPPKQKRRSPPSRRQP
ncbi:unnamed protein product [Coregonus sp. 'balchen']|nr:unnamed protein product [Coregonus sp. 'balchen']